MYEGVLLCMLESNIYINDLDLEFLLEEKKPHSERDWAVGKVHHFLLLTLSP